VALALWCGVALLVPEAAISWFAIHRAPVPQARSLIAPPVPGLDAPFTVRDDERDDAPRRFDLRGNEIAHPVARYRVDRRGTLYEVHSPETEVPHLRPPRT
jgi:hypothetical protein